MRLTLDLLGHRIEFAIDHPEGDGEPQREGSADAYVERADPYRHQSHELDHRPIGFHHEESK